MDVLVKMAELADKLDEMGQTKYADEITGIMVTAKKKMKGDSSDYLGDASGRFQSTFDSFARKIEGPTARGKMREKGVKERKVSVILDRIEEAISELNKTFVES